MTYLDKVWRTTIFYTTAPAGVAVLSHEMKFYVNVTAGGEPGSPLDSFQITRRNTGSDDLVQYVNGEFIALLKTNYAETDNFNRIELWAADQGSNDFVFYSAVNIDVDGTAGGLATLNHQTTITLRSQNGKTGRIQMMEDVSTSLSRLSYSLASGAQQDVANFVISDDSAHLTKDFSFFIASIFFNGGNSDALEKKRFR